MIRLADTQAVRRQMPKYGPTNYQELEIGCGVVERTSQLSWFAMV